MGLQDFILIDLVIFILVNLMILIEDQGPLDGCQINLANSHPFCKHQLTGKEKSHASAGVSREECTRVSSRSNTRVFWWLARVLGGSRKERLAGTTCKCVHTKV